MHRREGRPGWLREHCARLGRGRRACVGIVVLAKLERVIYEATIVGQALVVVDLLNGSFVMLLWWWRFVTKSWSREERAFKQVDEFLNIPFLQIKSKIQNPIDSGYLWYNFTSLREIFVQVSIKWHYIHARLSRQRGDFLDPSDEMVLLLKADQCSQMIKWYKLLNIYAYSITLFHAMPYFGNLKNMPPCHVAATADSNP